MEDDTGSELSTDEFPLLPEVTLMNLGKNSDISKLQASDKKRIRTVPLMVAIKGLFDLNNDNLQRLEERNPGVGGYFLAMLAD
ncbi:hypothetical protein EPUL_004580, partial [Erysiphe pulchra]